MLNRIAPVIGACILFTLAVGPAIAGIPISGINGFGGGRLPEPTTLTLFGLSVGGAFIAKKLFGRK